MIENLENEQWLPIDGFDGMYLISNYGRVKSLHYKNTNQERILKPNTTKDDYQLVTLYKDCKPKWLYVHRLVAMYFITNPNNLPQVNHKDENKCNNHVDNLEWCDCKYNLNYGTRNEKASKSLIGKFTGENHPRYGKFSKDNPTSKKVIQITLDNQFVKTWDSMMDIKRKLGYNQGNISNCCKGRQKSAYGYKWQYA